MSVRKRTRQLGVLQAHTPRLSSLRRIPLVLLFVAIRRKTVQKVATSIVCNIALLRVCSEAVSYVGVTSVQSSVSGVRRPSQTDVTV